MLSILDLTVRYPGRDAPAVRKVSLNIGKGEFIVLAGESASGKSTLMQAVCRFIPDIIPAEVSGRIRYKGKGGEENGLSALSRTVCMVQQDPESQFCTETVEEEVAFGPENLNYPRDQIERSVSRALGDTGIAHLRYRALASLSGGEKQKVAIASMLALRPKLLILDEPRANLDGRSVAEVMKAIFRLKKRLPDLSIIVVEHQRRRFMTLADRLIVMDRGVIVQDLERKGDAFPDVVSGALSIIEYPQIEQRSLGRETVLKVNGLGHTVDGSEILKDISFSVRKGSVLALMGRNGSGKTTVLRHLMGLCPVQKGRISIAGIEMFRKVRADPWELGQHVGMVFQNPNHQIFESTIERELAFGPKNFSRGLDRIDPVLGIYTRDEGVEASRHPHQLSYGQKRRLNIQAASIHQPGIVLLDEPFAGQDPRNAHKIAKLIAKLQRRGWTFIVVTHDPHFARRSCTQAVFLDGGKVLIQGNPGKVLDDERVRRCMGR